MGQINLRYKLLEVTLRDKNLAYFSGVLTNIFFTAAGEQLVPHLPAVAFFFLIVFL